MNDLVIGYALTIVLVGVVGFIFVVYRYLVADKYIAAEKRLRLKLNEATSYFRGDTEKAPDFIQKALGNVGIEGLMNEFGIDPSILNNPLVKGLIDKYAPRVLEQLKKGGNEQTVEGVELL
jgi:hypothetical protein